MKVVKALILIFVSVGLISPAGAAQPVTPLDKIYDQCVKKSGTINNGVVSACSDMASVAAKKQINLYYNRIYNRLSKEMPEDAKKLQEAQQAWISYRDKHCALAGSYVGSPMYDYCPMQLNIARAAELQELAQ